MATNEETYHEAASPVPGAEKSQMFGKACYKVNGKAFVCFFENEMVFKLTGEDHDEAMSLDGAQLFDPSGKGRPMKEWVQVPAAHAGRWKKLAGKAAVYVKGSS